MSHGRLNGRTALVTGGSSGIGRAVCQVFAREGANVAVLGRNAERLLETLKLLPTSLGNKHCMIQADVSSAEDVERSFKEAEKKLGKKVNILVSNAGIFNYVFFDEVKQNDFDDVIKTNLKGCFLINNQFVTLLSEEQKERESPCIINVSSIAGIRGIPCCSIYATTKSGIIALTKCIASEYQKHRVRCNAVLPGLTLTPMISTLSEDLVKEHVSSIPMGRLGTPEESANACLFLASDESSYVNGACLEVTGGAYA